jgi:hypothetical protein
MLSKVGQFSMQINKPGPPFSPYIYPFRYFYLTPWLSSGIRVVGRSINSIVCPETIISITEEQDTVRNQKVKFGVLIVAASVLLSSPVYAFNMGNMMNPSKWMGGNKNKDRYDDDYYDGPGYGYPGGNQGYGYGGNPGYGYPAGNQGYGYGGAPGYGYGGVPGYGAAPGYGGAPAYGAPGTQSNEAEIMRLRERIRQLEGGVR